MIFDDLLSMCVHSAADDWNMISCWGARSGPSYLDQFIPSQAANDTGGTDFRLQHNEHSNRAAYKPDLSVSIGFGLDPDEVFPDQKRELVVEDFVKNFSDTSWSFSYCDFIYNGNLVERVAYANVDGGRAVLPLPRHDGTVTRWQHDWFRILDSIGLYISEYDRYFDRSGITIRD